MRYRKRRHIRHQADFICLHGQAGAEIADLATQTQCETFCRFQADCAFPIQKEADGGLASDVVKLPECFLRQPFVTGVIPNNFK